jgi:hypothetical protein
MKLKDLGYKPTTKQMNKVMESRFGFQVDYNNMTFKKAYTLATGLTEGLEQVKRTHGAFSVEKNAKYMEMMMVRESLHRWMVENRQHLIIESEMAKSEAILAAKSMVDEIQDMLEKISKMQNEQMPALLDTIRDQISSEKAEGFKGAIAPILKSLYDTLSQGRESADSAARVLAGEQESDMDMDMGGGMGGMPGAPEGGLPGAEAPMGGAPEGDAFGATDAAAGGEAELGRERR